MNGLPRSRQPLCKASSRRDIAPAAKGTAFRQDPGTFHVGHWMWVAHHKTFGDDLVLLLPVRCQAVTGNGSWAWAINGKSKHKKPPESC